MSLRCAWVVVLLGACLWSEGALAEQKRLTVDLTWKNQPRSEGVEVYSLGIPVDESFRSISVRYWRWKSIESFDLSLGELSCSTTVDRGVSIVLRCSGWVASGWLNLSRLSGSDRGIELEMVWEDAASLQEPEGKPPPKGRKKIPVPLPKGSEPS